MTSGESNTPIKRIVIFGATSAIAIAAAREWATQGASFVLCGRSEQRLREVAQDLVARGAQPNPVIRQFDAANLAQVEQVATQVGAEGFDIALLAHGILNGTERNSAAELERDIRVNYLSYAIVSERLAAAIESAPQHGRAGRSIVFISSVAGDRGRRSNYLYGAGKAAVTALASGLRGRLNGLGVNVVTIKPGFVDTPMTAGIRKGLLFASAERVGKGIATAVEARRQVVYLPGFWWLIMSILADVPERLFHKLPI